MNIMAQAQSRMLKILQVNLHKNRERTHGVLNDPDMKEFTTIMIQEPYWSEYTKETPNHQAWTRYEPTNKERSPRAVTYVNKAHFPPAQVVQIETPFTDVVALQLSPTVSDEPPLLMINVYNPCDESIIQNLHEFLQRMHINSNSGIILAGDFNSHHPM